MLTTVLSILMAIFVLIWSFWGAVAYLNWRGYRHLETTDEATDAVRAVLAGPLVWLSILAMHFKTKAKKSE